MAGPKFPIVTERHRENCHGLEKNNDNQSRTEIKSRIKVILTSLNKKMWGDMSTQGVEIHNKMLHMLA